MESKKRMLAWLLAFLFLTVNMLVAVPDQAQAASGILFNPKISDFDGTQAEVQAALKDYKYANVKANPVAGDRYGINDSRGGLVTITSNEAHRIQGSDITLQSGKTYHMSFWAKIGQGQSMVIPQIWLSGSKWSGTVSYYGGALESVENTGGCIKGTDFLSADWGQYALSMNIDHLYTSGKEVGAVRNVEAFMAIFGKDGVFFNPTLFYIDGYYIIEEDTPTSTNYTRAQVANVKVAGGSEWTAIGTVLTASATTGDANPNAEITLSYQWQSSADGVTFTDIESATGANYTVQESDDGKAVRVVATAKSTGTVSGESSMSGASEAVDIAHAEAEATITVNAGANGSVQSGTQVVSGGTTGTIKAPWNQDAVLTIVPDKGYTVDTVTVNGAEQTVENNVLTLSKIRQNQEVSVTFRPLQDYKLTVTAEGKGNVTVDGTAVEGSYENAKAQEGSIHEITVAPEDGYLATVTVNGKESVERSKLSVTVAGDTDVKVVFTKAQWEQLTSVSLSENTSFYTNAIADIPVKLWGYDQDGNKKNVLETAAYVAFESSAPWIFSVKDGKLSTGSAAGSAVITATYLNPDGTTLTASVMMTRTEAEPVVFGFTPESSIFRDIDFLYTGNEVTGHDGGCAVYYEKSRTYAHNYGLRAYAGHESGERNWYNRGLRAAQGWFYDDGANNAGYYYMLADNKNYNSNLDTSLAGSKSEWGNMVYPIGAFNNANYYVFGNQATGIKRSVGWHQVVVMLKDAQKKIETYIDGQLVDSANVSSSGANESCIELRSCQGKQAGYETNVTYRYNAFFDDLAIYDLPASSAPAMAPVVTQAFLTGTPLVGETLTLSYQVKDYNNDELDQTKVVWEMSDDGQTGWTAIDGAAGDSLTLTEAQNKKFVRAAITPVAKAEPAQGETVYRYVSEMIRMPKQQPRVTDVVIDGEIAEDSVVTAKYNYIEGEEGDKEGASIITWELADEENGSYEKAFVGSGYTITSLVAGKYLRVTVTPVSKDGIQGDGVTSASVLIPGRQSQEALTYYVAVDGDDSNPGTIDKPFATLEGARDALRNSYLPEAGATVYLRGGTYYRQDTFRLEQQDSGREGAPIVYRAYKDEKVTIHGGYDLDMSKFQKVSGEMKDLLPAAAQDKVLVADLAELGVDKVEEYSLLWNNGGLDAPILIMDGQALHIARYPNDRNINTWPQAYCSPGAGGYEGTNLGNGTTDSKDSFTVKYDDTTAARVQNWTYGLDHIAAEGYWAYDWYASTVYATLDKSKHYLSERDDLPTTYGVAKNSWRRFCFKNVYQELDDPGEYYLDFNTQKLYVYPHEGSGTSSALKMGKLDKTMIEMQDVSYVTFSGIELTGGMKGAVNIVNGKECNLDQCRINGFSSDYAVTVNGKDCTISNGEIAYCGVGGVNTSGGDIQTMEHANIRVENNKIHDFSLLKTIYSAAVQMETYTVGVTVSHNEIYNCEHEAIQFRGVEHTIEYNIFHDACTNAADMGVIYTGRWPTDHGTVIRYNHFYDIGNPLARDYSPCAIFTDDGSSDLDVYGNVFGTGFVGVESIKIHGGQYNKVYHNLFVDAPKLINDASWDDGMWRKFLFWTSNFQFPCFERFDVIRKNPLYWEKWPWVKEASDAYDAGKTNTVKHYDNTFAENIVIFVNEDLKPLKLNPNNQYRSYDGWWMSWGNRPITGLNGPEGNTNRIYKAADSDTKAMFEDFDKGNYRLKDESIYQQFDQIDLIKTPFEPIPFDKIGMYKQTGTAPRIVGAWISGGGTVLSGRYDYVDDERDPEGTSLYRWFVSDKAEGPYTVIEGAAEATLTVTDDLKSKFVKFEVTPVSYDGTAGTPVQTAAFIVAADKTGLLNIIASAEEAANGATVGEKLGNYPQDAVDALKAAIAEAKKTADDETATSAQIGQAASALSKAYDSFKTQAKNSETTAEDSVTVPEGLSDVTVTFTGDQKEWTVTVDGGIAPDLVMTAGGVKVTVAKGTEIPGGKLVIRLPEQPSVQVFGTVTRLVQVGEQNDRYNLPIRIEFDGKVTQDIVRISGESYEKVGRTLSTDSAAALGDDLELGKVSTGENRVAVWTKLGGEYFSASLVDPSADASLSGIMVNGKNYVKFSPAVFSYKYVLPAGTVTVPIVTATAANEKATLVIEQATALPGTAKITVTAEDLKTTAVYEISFYVLSDEKPDDGNDDDNDNPGGSGSSGGYIPPSGGIGGTTGGGNRPGTVTEPTKSSPFSDILGHWAEKDITAMYERKIVSGVTDTTFEPDRAITRAEFATLMGKALNLKAANSAGFRDVAEGAWYASSVNAAAAAGLITGYDGAFRPEDLITREEMAVIIAKAYTFLGKTAEKGGIDKFADAGSISDWARDSVDLAAAAGLISGVTESEFRPQENATRAQCVSILARLLK